MAWWSSPGANPNWRPPRIKPGRDKLRESLGELLHELGGVKEFRTELKLSKDAFARFMEGDDDALTLDELRAVARYLSGFGRDMKTNRLIRTGRS
jgi:hypothetical protein